MRFNPLPWFVSIHAKLFMVTALVTSFLTITVAYTITRNSRRELLNYSKNLAIDTSRAVEAEILGRDPRFQDPHKIEEILESLAGPDRSVFQIDVFKANTGQAVTLVTSSGDEERIEWDPEIGIYMASHNPAAELVDLNTGSRAWKIYLPIRNPKPGKPPIGLIRTYCDLERWEIVWENNLHRTYKILPPVILGEFILLWVILGALLSDPLKLIMEAMKKLERGDRSARAHVQRRDELGLIANRFNHMAAQIQRASEERESLISEIQGLNTGLQERIDAALAELQAKNFELEQLMERIALLREELGQQERLAIVGQLASVFAHEVGTPLNLVNGHLQLLLGQGPLDAKTRERLEVIHAQIQRVGDIVRKLLGHARMPELRRTPFPIATMVEELQRLWNPTLMSRSVALTARFPEQGILHVDHKQMEQLFINLVNNAVDAMPNGGDITLLFKPDPSSPTSSPRWDVVVTDTGHGIPQDLLPMIFKPMFTTKAEGKGTGLGLSICREIVRAHGGDMRIESQEGQGTRVVFSLPGES